MKAIRLSFMQMLLFVRRDKMLVAVCFVPLLAGVFFKFAIPAIDRSDWTSAAAILVPYYGLFDLFLSILAPMMFCFAAAMVVLEEHDDHIEHYLFVTTLGRKGYIISRIGLPAVIAFIVTLILLPVFGLTDLSVSEVIFLSVAGALQGVIIGLLVVTLSKNKLEGMVVVKISMLTMSGLIVPYFVTHQLQYVLLFLPSFWIGKVICDRKLIYVLPSMLLILIWIYYLLKKYLKKIS